MPRTAAGAAASGATVATACMATGGIGRAKKGGDGAMEWGEWRNQTHPASPCSPLPIALFWRVHSAIALHAASQCPLEQEELAFDQASDHLAETLAQTRFARDIKLCSAKNHYRKCRRRPPPPPPESKPRSQASTPPLRATPHYGCAACDVRKRIAAAMASPDALLPPPLPPPPADAHCQVPTCRPPPVCSPPIAVASSAKSLAAQPCQRRCSRCSSR